jgi:hypothetical protein
MRICKALLFAFDYVMFGELYLLGFGLGLLFRLCTTVHIHSFVVFLAVSATRTERAAHQT